MANGNNFTKTFILLWLMFDFGIAHKINNEKMLLLRAFKFEFPPKNKIEPNRKKR